MVDIRLTYNNGYKWISDGTIYIKGRAFYKEKLLSGKELLAYFQKIDSEDSFQKKLSELNGLFAVIIHQQDLTLAAVDRSRSFPLLYFFKGGNLIITDNYRTLLNDSASDLQINDRAKKMMLSSGYVFGKECLIKDVFQIQSGEYISFSGQELKSRFWHLTSPELKNKTKENWKNEIKNCIFTAGKRLLEMIAGRPVALPLSGGFDSRLIALLLRANHYENVRCFTFGNPSSKDAEKSKSVSKRLNYSWEFIDYKPYIGTNYIKSAEYNEYIDFAGNAISFPYIQEFFAGQHLKHQRQMPENTLILPGHSGDTMGGSHVFPDMKSFVSQRDLAKKIYRKNCIQISHSKTEKAFLLDVIEKDTFPERYSFSHLSQDDWNFRERQSKQTANSSKVWDFFGYEYFHPLWDNDLMAIFASLPFEYKVFKNLYNEIVKELFCDFNILFEDEKESDIRKKKFQFCKFKLKSHIPWLKRIKHNKNGGDFFYFRELVLPMQKSMKPFKYLEYNAVLSMQYIGHVEELLHKSRHTTNGLTR